MEPLKKTPVQLTQELIAIETTRKEAVEKLRTLDGHGELTAMLDKAEQQAVKHLADLLGELSGYGDGVVPAAERDNEYQQTWTGALADLGSRPTADLKALFLKMEEQRSRFYRNALENAGNLPASALELLRDQANDQPVVP